MSWTHDGLQHDLAETRRQVGDIAAEKLGIGSWAGGGQIDVFALKPSWTQSNPTVYEVKISRSDFMRDVQAGKYRNYLPYCRRLYFAAPGGLLKKADVPEGMGLTVRGENGWHTVVAPRIRQVEEKDFRVIVFSLLLKLTPSPWSPPTREDRILQMARAKEIDSHTRGLSRRVRAALARGEDAERRLQYATATLASALDADPEAPHDIGALARTLLDRAPAAAAVPDTVKGALEAVGRDADSIRRMVRGAQEAVRRAEAGR